MSSQEEENTLIRREKSRAAYGSFFQRAMLIIYVFSFAFVTKYSHEN